MDTEATLKALAALHEPLRFKMYRLAVSAPQGVTRDLAAETTGVARSVAAFHLDKLADLGLLTVDYRRPPGVGGPGAGRPAKWYHRSDAQFDLSVPPRRYELAASILAEAVEAAGKNPATLDASLVNAASRHGADIGTQARKAGVTNQEELLQRLVVVLGRYGYEPASEDTGLVLRNCPFHVLVGEHRGLTCSVNLQLLTSAAQAAGLPNTIVSLDPAPDRCCVRLQPKVAKQTKAASKLAEKSPRKRSRR